MSDLLWQGLLISLTGLGLTFTVLGLLILTIILLERFSRSRSKPPEQEAVTADTPARSPADEEVTAAIVAALAHLHALEGGRNALGSTLEAGPGAWWKMGRTHQQFFSPLLRQHHGETNHEFEL